MSKSKQEIKYTAEVLLKSKALSAYQQDFAKVILADGEYTIEEAINKIEKALNKKER